MHRLAPVLLIGGALLFANGVYAPAAPIAPGLEPPAAGSLSEQARPVMAAVTREIDRLRSRLTTPAGDPTSQRDPFRFGGREPEPGTAPDSEVAPIAAPAPAIELPRLVAVIEMPGDDGVAGRSASLAIGSVIHVVKAGEVIGQFTVHGIDPGFVLLQDRATTAVYRISLR